MVYFCIGKYTKPVCQSTPFKNASTTVHTFCDKQVQTYVLSHKALGGKLYRQSVNAEVSVHCYFHWYFLITGISSLHKTMKRLNSKL